MKFYDTQKDHYATFSLLDEDENETEVDEDEAATQRAVSENGAPETCAYQLLLDTFVTKLVNSDLMKPGLEPEVIEV